MGKLMVGVMRFLPLCAVVLVLPAIAASQSNKLTVQAYDHASGTLPEGSASFTVRRRTETTVILDWVRTYSGETDDVQEQTIFTPGEAIRYNAQVTNAGSSTVTAELNYLVTGPKEILSVTGDVSIPPGSWWHFVDSTVPIDAPTGAYTLQVISLQRHFIQLSVSRRFRCARYAR